MRVQNPDQLVNFRNIQKTLTDYQERLAGVERELAKAINYIGLLASERRESSAASATGAPNAVQVVVDFGSSFTHFSQTVVTGEAWVTVSSVITASLTNTNPVEASLFQFSLVVSDLVAGDGFTLSVYTPVEAKGTYTFNCIGVD